MGLQFRWHARIAPGVHLNLTKRGVRSVSLGGRGATVNVNREGLRPRLSWLGTGLSWLFGRRKW